MPYSTYSRLRDILKSVQIKRSVNLFDLADAIHDEEIESFSVFRRQADGTIVTQYCLPESIRRLIRFARTLGLVDIGEKRIVSLTSEGTNALAEKNYNAQLATQVKAYLDDGGCGFSLITKTIKRIKLPEVPDAYTIYERLRTEGAKLRQARFRTAINLLVRTGELEARTRRLLRP